jgi:hypothetical protein
MCAAIDSCISLPAWCCAVIDYLGFRLIAITILPINGNTIKYGSYV